MHITKIGHSCVLVEEDNTRILVDPGVYTDAQNMLKNIDLVLITHEHPDHIDPESLEKIIQNNPDVKVITNAKVAEILKKQNIQANTLSNGFNVDYKNAVVEAFGNVHAEIHPTVECVDNIGFLINERIFFPGDSFFIPKNPVEILALPVSGPWMKLSEAIDYAIELKPKTVFPIHDGALKFFGSLYKLPERVLKSNKIDFWVPELNKPYEF